MPDTSPPLIIGFDILPHSSPSGRKSAQYAIAIMQGEVLETHSSMVRNELLKTIRNVKPDILATDNLLELAPHEKGVIDFLSKIPSKTRIIQVTGSPLHGMTSLPKLARRHGLTVNKHPSPTETAKLVARLASLGVGTEISALARETRIIVSRARNIGPGGFSQSRFQRRMHGAIQQVARNILDKLKKTNKDFDQYETRTSYGWSRCIIHVYDSYDNVSKIAKSEVNRIAGVAVRITPVKHRSILYLHREDKDAHLSPRRLLVIGVDAGITVGIAISDVEGRLIALRSGRGLSRGDVIRYIVEFGKPVLIATDVAPIPNFIEKLSNALHTPLFAPEKLMTLIEKRELAKSFATTSGLRPTNAHQRDALSAVAKVFQVYETRLEQLSKRLQESEQRHNVAQAVALTLQGLSVNDALKNSVIPEPPPKLRQPAIEPPKPEQKSPTPEELQSLVDRLQRQVESIKRQLDHERNQHDLANDEKTKIENELRQTKRLLNRALNQEQQVLRRDKRIREKEADIQRFQKKIHEQTKELNDVKRTLTNLKLMRRLEIRGEVQPVLVLAHFSQDEIRQLAVRHPQRRVKIVFIRDPSGGGSSTANQLIQLGVQIVITQGTMSHLALQQFNAEHIPVINSESLQVTIVDEFAVVNVEQLNYQIAQWRGEHKLNEREAAAEALERLIEEYRQERRNGSSERK
ncbi:MAG: DUF460 domain-containing protein [Candidatus Thorarchaeota archaeon]